MDMAAVKTEIEAGQLRLRNLIGADELPYKVASGIVWDKSGFREGLEKAATVIGYDALRAQQQDARAAGRWFGIGVACYAELTGLGSRISVAPGMPINTGTETAIIRIDSTGAVTAAFGIASHGQGLETTLAQIVAEHLGARFAEIRIVQGDSARRPRRHRHLCQPQPGAGRRRGDVGRSGAARESVQGCLAPFGGFGCRPPR